MSSRKLQRTIENPTLELKIISANAVSYFDAADQMDVYAVVSIKGDNTQEKQTAKTPIDYDGGSNPTWNHTVKFSVNEKTAREGLLTVHVKLFSYWLEDKDDLYLGEVSVSVRELLASDPLPPFANGNVNKMRLVTYPVKSKGETKPNAKLIISYRFKPVPVSDLYPLAPDYLPSFSEPVYPNLDPTRQCQPIKYSPQFQTNTMTKLTLELVIKFAKDLKKVNILNDMDIYASVTIREGKKTIKNRSNTHVALCAYQNPRWDHAVKFPLDQRLAQEGRLTLFVELVSHRPFCGDKQIGQVNISIQELLGMNPPALLTNGEGTDMMLVTEYVSGSYGKKGTLTFTYRFLTEQVVPPKASPSTNNTQPLIMAVPVSHQEYTSPGYVTAHPGSHLRPNNGLVPIYMAPPYQSHGYQQYSPQHTQWQLQQPPQQYQLLPQESQPPPHPHQQPHPQPLHDTQSESYQSFGAQHYSSMHLLQQEQLQMPPKQSTQSQEQTVKWQGGGVTALGLGAAVLGRAIGGALISEMTSDEVNVFDLGA